MILVILFSLFLGIFAGTITGLFPGIHINLIAATLLASLTLFANLPAQVLVVFIVAMAITHTFLDFIPSIFLGAPEEDSFLAVLPGHQLLREGNGHEAVVLTLYGSLFALPIILLFTLVFTTFLAQFFDIVRITIPYVLIFVSLYLIFREEEFLNSLTVFLLAGFLGLLTFNLPVKQPLLPLLTGLFGISALAVSLKSKFKIPPQKIKPLKKIRLGRKSFLKSGLAAAVSAPFCSFLPGIGAGHAAVIGSEMTSNFGKDKRSFLFLVGAINTIVMGLSFVTIYAIGRTRTGAATAVENLLGKMVSKDLILILAIVLISGIFAFIIGVNLSKFLAKNIVKINYSKLSIGIISLLIVLNLFLSNPQGLLILITASALGVFAITSNVRRINLMGALLIPTILFYILSP